MMLMILILAANAPDTLWANVTSGGVYSTVEIGDLNGDGVPDVASGVNFWDDEPTLWCLSGADGNVLWTSDQYKGIYQDEGLAGVPDMNGDGIAEVAVAGDNSGTVCLDGATGTTLWSYPTGSNTWSVAWAFLSSNGTSCGEHGHGGFTGNAVQRNPSEGIMVLTPPEGEWSCGIYDISGRLVWSDKLSGEETVDVSSWNSGCFLVVLSDGAVELRQTVTVLN